MPAAEILVFDLDHTLYPPTPAIERNVDAKIMAFFQRELRLTEAEAAELMVETRRRQIYETELADKYHFSRRDFLYEICDVDVGMLAPDTQLAAILSGLPRRKFIFTDSSRGHVESVLAQLQVPSSLFEKIVDADDTAYKYKGSIAGYEAFCALAGVSPRQCVMFEDSISNLRTAKQAGFQTILISPDKSDAAADWVFADIKTALLSPVLSTAAQNAE